VKRVAMGENKSDRIGLEELRYISILQDLTGAMVYRALEDDNDNRIIYLVDRNDVGKAIGRDGRNVKMLSKMLNKNIEIVEYANDIDNMVRNLLPGVTVLKVEVTERDGLKIVYVKVKDDEKGKAIGRDGRNVKRARLVLNRLFNVDRVVIR
jgi:NusA family KH domain protein, archaeal